MKSCLIFSIIFAGPIKSARLFPFLQIVTLHFESVMLTLEQCRQIDPELNKLSDEELLRVRVALYELAGIIFDDWATEESVPSYPVGVLRDS